MTDPQPRGASFGNYRWRICALLFFATTINYLDRSILGVLAPTLKEDIGWTDIEYGYIGTVFTAAYALGLVGFGWFVDRFGTKIGYAVSLTAWSLAAMAHALVSTVLGFGIVRGLLGLSESGNFPSAIKATAEWFPKKERALATGIFNSGANIGAILAPAVVPWLTITYGWPAAFVVTGGVGLVWLFFWGLYYRRPEDEKKLSKAELEYIQSDKEEVVKQEKIPWLHLLRFRQTWAFVIGKFMTDPVWWFYLYWLGLYLNENFGVKLKGLALPLIVIYTMSSVGSIGGGWFSGFLIGRGMVVGRARRLTMLLFACMVVPVVIAAWTQSMWLAVLLIGVAAAAHQGWSANIFTTVSDMFPKRAVGSVTGLGGMAGSVGGMLFMAASGWILKWTGNYVTLFLVCGSAYLLALGIMTVLTWKAKPVDL
jgi:ACS family hexuronate transporter-like MFS transporter